MDNSSNKNELSQTSKQLAMLHSSEINGEVRQVVDVESDTEDFASVPVERVNSFTSPPDSEIVYRSLAVMPPQHNIIPVAGYDIEGDLSAAKCGNIEKPQLSRRMSSSGSSNGTANVTYFASDKKYKENKTQLGTTELSEIIYASEKNVVSKKPFLLMDTHVLCDDKLENIVNNLNQELGDMSEVSFEYNQNMYKWTAICLQLTGASSCKMQIQIYNNGTVSNITDKGDGLSPSGPDTESYIIEFNRLSGDHAPFRTAFNKLKRNLFAPIMEDPSLVQDMHPGAMHDSLSTSMSTSVPFFDMLAEEEAHEALEPILNMAKEGKIESMIEAARIFCDLSLDDNLQQYLCEPDAMSVLLRLAGADAPELARQYTFMALANLSMHHGHCQERIIDAGALPTILPLVSNGTYENAEMRREGARLLANLSGGLATRVVSELGHQTVSSWLDTVEELADERVKLHAMQAREQLTSLVA